VQGYSCWEAVNHFIAVKCSRPCQRVRSEERWEFPGVQGLRLYTFNVKSVGSIPGLGTKISHATAFKKKKRNKPENWKQPDFSTRAGITPGSALRPLFLACFLSFPMALDPSPAGEAPPRGLQPRLPPTLPKHLRFIIQQASQTITSKIEQLLSVPPNYSTRSFPSPERWQLFSSCLGLVGGAGSWKSSYPGLPSSCYTVSFIEQKRHFINIFINDSFGCGRSQMPRVECRI